ncbi:MAG: rhodanese-related sulfurtransferase [Alphaproteobacteria bacterium PRO2]|nr:rhodanese-related sulfurtransferase [Alphaproteobacteria bacterium PRO2]
MTYKIAAFYRFTPVEDIDSLRAEIVTFGKTLQGMCGTILLAPEGINATIGAKEQALDKMIDFLDARLGIRQGELKYSESAGAPFNRFKVRPKKEIITMRRPEADPNVRKGEYVEAADWNALMNDPDVTLIDTRNIYETEVGIFQGALDPKLGTFTEFPAWVEKNLDPAKHKKVAMFCTGGIRCEKASSYMLAAGFEKIYHLKGGILKYLETIPADQSKWDGACFVFDKRVSVIHGLEEGRHTICHGCRAPLAPEDTSHAKYEEGVSCAHCADALTPERTASLRARHKHFLERYSG